mgnify:CR=1 FL=1
MCRGRTIKWLLALWFSRRLAHIFFWWTFLPLWRSCHKFRDLCRFSPTKSWNLDTKYSYSLRIGRSLSFPVQKILSFWCCRQFWTLCSFWCVEIFIGLRAQPENTSSMLENSSYSPLANNTYAQCHILQCRACFLLEEEEEEEEEKRRKKQQQQFEHICKVYHFIKHELFIR